MPERILVLADELEALGVQVGHLRPLQVELDLVEKPPGMWKRLSARALTVARLHWERAVGELRESREMVALVRRHMGSQEALTLEEVDRVRTQLGDLLRLVPATVIVATNQVLPVPGTSLFTPMLLRRLGLLPSRWREAHLLHELQLEAERLHALGRHRAAERVEALQHELEDEADAREAAAVEADLLTHWDANHNGIWDPPERAAYALECDKVRRLVAECGHQKRWFLSADGGVVGPLRLTELGPIADLLVCFEGRTGWVALSAVREPPG